MNLSLKKILRTISLLLLLISAGYAQNGTVEGYIFDSQYDEPLPGANVYIEGTSMGAAADVAGKYLISGVPAGDHTLVVKYIGYVDKTLDITVVSGETTEKIITLDFQSIEGEVIEVTAQAKGQMAAINQQLSSNSITNIVSSDKIKEVPDVNAAESIGRLPGVSLKRSGGEGNKVVVRGLSPQYSIVEVDGVRLEGVDLDRSVGLSTISSEMLDGIELSKTLTADRDADAIGGIVNLKTRTAREGLHYNLLTQGGYNNLETSFNNYKLSGNISNRFFDNQLGVLLNIGTEQVIRSSDRYNASFGSRIETDVNDITNEVVNLYSDNASVRENKSLRKRHSGSLILDYHTDFWIFDNIDVRLNNFYLNKIDDNEVRNNQFRFSDSEFRLYISDSKPDEIIQTHSLNTTFDVFNTELKVDISYSNTKLDNANDEYEFDDNTVISGNGSITELERRFTQPSDLIEDRYDISSVTNARLYINTRDLYVRRRDETKTINMGWKVPYTFSDAVSGNIKAGFKYNQKDRSSDKETIWSTYYGGIGGDRKDRVYAKNPDFLRDQDIPGYLYTVGIPALNFVDEDYDYGKILDGRFDLGWSADLDKLKKVHNYDEYPLNQIYRKGIDSNRDDYKNREDRTAAYIMAEINLGESLMLEPGVRYEKMQTDYSAQYIVENAFAQDGLEAGYPINTEVNDRTNEHFFPSVNSKYKVNEWSSVRAAYFKSASRPDYRRLSPGLISDNLRENITAYNPYLRPAIAHNFDIGVSFFTNEIGFFTINGFYKEVSDVIYNLPRYQPSRFDEVIGAPEALLESLEKPRALYPGNLYTRTTEMNNFPINNPNKTYFSGFEINWQTNFWYLPGLLRGLVLDLNYTWIKSTTRFPYLRITQIGFEPGFPPIAIYETTYHTKQSRMLDQPRHLFNARIGWDYLNFSSRLSFRYQGQTVQSLDPVYNISDSFIEDEFRMDFTAKQKITENLSVILDLSNITEVIEDARLKTHNLLRSSEFYGFTSQLGLRYEY